MPVSSDHPLGVTRAWDPSLDVAWECGVEADLGKEQGVGARQAWVCVLGARARGHPGSLFPHGAVGQVVSGHGQSLAHDVAVGAVNTASRVSSLEPQSAGPFPWC